MLRIFHSRGSFLIFDKETYKTLRSDHRIVARLVGVGNENQSQLLVCEGSLPGVLSNEQARYLSERLIAEVCELESEKLDERLGSKHDDGSVKSTTLKNIDSQHQIDVGTNVFC